MSLEIRTTPAQIGVRTTPGSLELRQPQADMQIENQLPKVSIENSFVQVRIDQTKPFSEAGLKPVLDWAYDAAARAREAVSTYTSNTTTQGNEMADFYKGGNAVAEQADYNAFGQFAVDYNVDSVPKSKPDITFIEGKAAVSVESGQALIETRANPADIRIGKAAVEVYLQQKNSITITPTVDRVV